MNFKQGFYLHSAKNLQASYFDKFEAMKKNGQLCDVIVKCENQSIAAHRVVLAAAIPYFNDVFSGSFVKDSERIVTLEGIPPCSLEPLIHFAYTCELKITKKNVESLLQASSYLHLDTVRNLCCQLLTNNLNPSNVVRIRQLADSLNCVGLLRICDRHISENFETISKSSEIVKLPFSVLDKITSRDDVTVLSENLVFEAIMKWVKGSVDERQAVLPKLLMNIRMPFLAPDYLINHVAKEELIKASFACRDVIEEAKNYYLLPENSSLFNKASKRPRRYRNFLGHGIYAFCYRTCSGHSVNYFNSDSEKWVSLVTLNPSNHKFDRFIATNGYVYAMGDHSEVLNTRTLEWTTCESLNNTISGFQTVVIGPKIYAFGQQSSRQVSCFDTENNTWLKISPMKVSRHSVGAAVLRETVYITGGILSEWFSTCSVTNRVESYQPETAVWIELTPMLNKRHSHSCASLNAKVYACGGYEDEMLSTAEAYDPITDQWSYISSMGSPRQSFPLVAYDGKIYAFDSTVAPGQSFAHNVDIYNPKSNEWKAGPPIYCQHDSETSVRAVAIMK